MSGPVLSIVVPAHNEAAVITRMLQTLVPAVAGGEFEVVVAANGCTDGTADLARAVHPEIKVVETVTPSKIAALNLGDATATTFPRAYVDADVLVDADTLRALAGELRRTGGPLVAAPPLQVDASRSSWAVRAHYRIWELTDYRTTGHVGSGIYALSETGRRRFGSFPDVIADDRYVQQLFAADERGSSPRGSFTVRAPRTFRALLHRSVRAAAGNAQLRSVTTETPAAAGGSGIKALVVRVSRKPLLWPAFAVYCVGYAVPRVLGRRKLARGRTNVWERDETSRNL